MSYYTLPEIQLRRAEQISLGFDFPSYYSSLSDGEIMRAANGVGPDSLPAGARRILTGLLPYAELAADVHDVEFERSNAMRSTFAEANARFGHNCRLWVKANRSRLNPIRYLELFRISRDVEILNGSAGWRAWIAAWSVREGC